MRGENSGKRADRTRSQVGAVTTRSPKSRVEVTVVGVETKPPRKSDATLEEEGFTSGTLMTPSARVVVVLGAVLAGAPAGVTEVAGAVVESGAVVVEEGRMVGTEVLGNVVVSSVRVVKMSVVRVIVGRPRETVVVGREIWKAVSSACTVRAGANPSPSASAALVMPANRRVRPVLAEVFTPTALIGSWAMFP
jgi:hypothetical protein